MQLLLGCGSNRTKKLTSPGRSEWKDLVTLDHEARHKPDVVHDLNIIPLPFEDNSADEIHAYEVLEHVGTQGDYRFFFKQWADFWRILKPDGVFFASVPLPSSVWAWGDPSHTRIVTLEQLVFLGQPSYAQVGKTAMSDFRSIYQADFDLIHSEKTEHCLFFALKAIKPARIT